MPKKTLHVSSFPDFCKHTTSTALHQHFYRGQSRADWDLRPSAGRLTRHQNQNAAKLRGNEMTMLRQFQKEGTLMAPQAITAWDWLFLARHHGLPTRLLDWSRNPLVALYFAVTEKSEGDAIVYAEKNHQSINILKVTDPFSIKEVSKILPFHVTPRVTGQEGLFTIHPEPTKNYDSPTLMRLIISSKLRQHMKLALEKCGIHAASMFRDLDGLARKISRES